MKKSPTIPEEALRIICKHYPNLGLKKTISYLRFKGYEIPEKRIVYFLKKRKIKRLVPTLFKKGQVSHTKGKKLSAKTLEKVSKTFFKKGHTPSCMRNEGDEKIRYGGFVYVKVGMPNVWKLKHHLVWLQSGKTIPAGHVLIFIDGDKTNCSIENLECISRAENLRRNRRAFLADVLAREKAKVRRAEEKRSKRRKFLIEKYGGLVAAYANGEIL